MICYRCKMEAFQEQFCPTCGTDLRLFQKAYRMSNAYYNDGLHKAQVRNLSGAVTSLRTSLKFNKYNVDARNLLGLVYFELGEAVDALGEWVISKSYFPEDNRAGYYLEEIQQNQSALAKINQTVKKYNQAVIYCRQGSRDLAELQMRKVLALNPKLVKGNQLMALLYMQEDKLEQAKRCLRNAAKVDTNNTLTMRYLREVNQRMREQGGKRKKRQIDDDLISYQSGNETIIMPRRFKESSLGGSLMYMIIGLIVGAAVTGFLVIPSIRQSAMEDARQQLVATDDSISTYKNTIASLESEIEQMQTKVDEANQDSKNVEVEINSYDRLLRSYVAYTKQDMINAGKVLAKVNTDYLSQKAKDIYDELAAEVEEPYMKALYEDGYEKYSNNQFEEAVEDLKAVTEKDMDYEEGMAAYYLAQSYRKLNDSEAAQPYYQYVVDKYPNTERGRTSQNYLEE